MKKIILFALLCLPLSLLAQKKADTILTTGNGKYIAKTKEYIAPGGERFKKGDYVLIGQATSPNGEYKFLSTASMAGSIPLKGGWEGSRFIIRDIILRGSDEFGHIAILKLGNDHSGKYLCSADQALKSGELQSVKNNER